MSPTFLIAFKVNDSLSHCDREVYKADEVNDMGTRGRGDRGTSFFEHYPFGLDARVVSAMTSEKPTRT